MIPIIPFLMAILLAAVFGLPGAGHAVVLDQEPVYNLAPGMFFLEDGQREFSVEDVLTHPYWQQNEKPAGNQGYSDSIFWFKVPISVRATGTWYIALMYPVHDEVDFYWIENDAVIDHERMGDRFPFSQRPVPTSEFVVYRDLQAGDELELIIRIDTSGTYQVPLEAYTQTAFEAHLQTNNLVKGGYYGIMLVMALYNLMIFLITRMPAYRNYVVYVMAFVFLQLSFDGTGFQYLWPDMPAFNRWAIPVSFNLALLAFVFFSYTFLNLHRARPLGRYYFWFLMVLSGGLLLLTLTVSYGTLLRVSNVLSTPIILSCLVAAVVLGYRGERYATVFAIATLLFICGLVIGNLRSLGAVETNFLTFYGYMIGSVLEVVLFALALGIRIAEIREDKLRAETETLNARELAVSNLERYERLYESSLSGNFVAQSDGYIVNGNTAFWSLIQKPAKKLYLQNCFEAREAALEILNSCLKAGQIKNQEFITEGGQWVSLQLQRVELDGETRIEGSLTDISSRKAAEAIKDQAEKDKMNALQQLVVGVAHEMNTPLGVVRTSADLTKSALEKLTNEYGTGTLTKQKFSETVAEGTAAINLVEENLVRVSNLIDNFKLVSVQQMQFNVGELDVNELARATESWIEARGGTIKLLVKNHQDREFDTFPDAIFWILQEWIDNSFTHGGLDAINVFLDIDVSDDELSLKYSDNGKGIDPQFKSQIFEPFFTTQRGANKKIGLGLYQVHNLVHQLLKGKLYINCDHRLEFVMTVPNLRRG